MRKNCKVCNVKLRVKFLQDGKPMSINQKCVNCDYVIKNFDIIKNLLFGLDIIYGMAGTI